MQPTSLFDGLGLELESQSLRLRQAKEQWVACTACELSKTRACVVTGRGHPVRPQVMILGAYPSKADGVFEQSGSGAVGEYLRMILSKAGFNSDLLYHTSMVKCWDGERAPTEGELAACLPHLRAEIKIVHPMTILGLGESVVRVIRCAIDDEKEKPEKDRRAHSLSDRGWVQWEKTPILFTLPPAFLMVEKNEGTLREKKRRVWEDVTKVMAQVRALTI